MTIAKNSRTKSEINDADTDDVLVTLYTCPANAKAHISLLYITNSGTAASNIEIQWYRASQAETHSIIAGKNLSVGEFINYTGGFFVLEEGDIIKFKPSSTAGGASPHIDCLCTVEEFFNPVGG